MAAIFWIGALAAVAGIFVWMWRFATHIEAAENEEREWILWVTQMKLNDPQNTWYYDKMFEDRFYR